MVHAQDKQAATSPRNASEKEKKMLQIRGDLQGLLFQEDWSAVGGMLRGIRYADAELLVSLILWRNKWQQSEPTLLHDILTMPESDPPLSLLQMVIDTAPQVLYIEDADGNLALYSAIYSSSNNRKRSLEIINFLVKRDRKRLSLTPVTFWQAIRRADESVIRYLLQYPACAKALVIPVNGRVPLYYISKNSSEKEISPLLRLLLEATCDYWDKKWCCVYACILFSEKYLYDAPTLLELARTQKLYCTNHLVDVAQRTTTTTTTTSNKREESEASTTNCNDKKSSPKQHVDNNGTTKNESVATTTESSDVADDQIDGTEQVNNDVTTTSETVVPTAEPAVESKTVPGNETETNTREATTKQDDKREATTSSPHGVAEE